MTLIFCGNDYKYEIEGIMKLFIPASRFKIVYSDTAAGEEEYAFILERDEGAEILLSVKTVCFGKTASREMLLARDDSSDRELLLSKMLFECMSEITGIRPKWGVMTGVRPVKRVNKYLSEGYSKEEIRNILSEDFYCSEEKFEIAYRTAMTQADITSTLPKDSFSLYVSIPFCPTRCSYCSFISQTVDAGKKIIPAYIDKLCEEIRYTGKLAAKLGLRLDTVYFGGGTPTSVSAAYLSRIMRTVSESFDMSVVREYTVEAGRADTITQDKLEAIMQNGCSRISVNPQTLNNSVLQAIGRKHTAEQFLEAFALARSLGFDEINTDIIAGLPTDTPESFERTISGLIDLSPENITVHTLSIKRAADLNRSEEKSTVLRSAASVMVDTAGQKLLSNGFAPYYLYRQKNMLENLENIGWSKPGHESLYNIFIMEEIQTILAVGAGASSKLVDLEGGRLERIFNYKLPLEYVRSFDYMLEKKKAVERFYAEKE